jgi:hypothetical protein
MSIRVDPSSHSPRPRSSDSPSGGSPSGGSPFAWAAVLRLLGALLCMGGAMVMLVTEFVSADLASTNCSRTCGTVCSRVLALVPAGLGA